MIEDSQKKHFLQEVFNVRFPVKQLKWPTIQEIKDNQTKPKPVDQYLYGSGQSEEEDDDIIN